MTTPEAEASRRLQKQAGWFGRITVLLGLVIVYLAAGLARGF